MPGFGFGFNMGLSRRGGGIPAASKALCYIDLTKIDGNTVTDRTSSKIFTIADKDFTASYFPYKSAATISAPVGDATLIAADINNFWYDSAGDPNAIPVVSFFQNIDYDNKIYSLHVSQRTNWYGVETREPYIKEIVWYSEVLTDTDLKKANSYFAVPAAVTENVQWVSKDGNDTTGDGSKESPYLTVLKGYTEASGTDLVYVKTGQYTEMITGTLSLNIYGLGGVEMNPVDYCIKAYADISVQATHINFNSSAAITVRALVALTADNSWTFDKCRIYSSGTAFYNALSSANTLNINNCVIADGIIFYQAATININTTLYHDAPANPIAIYGTVNSTNSLYTANVGTAGICILKATGFDVTFKGDTINTYLMVSDVTAYDGSVTWNYCTLNSINGVLGFGNGPTGAIDWTISNCVINSNGTSASMFNILTSSGDIVFSNNTVNDFNGILSFKGVSLTQTLEFKGNTIISDVAYSAFVYSESLVNTIENNIIYGGSASIRVWNDLGTAQVSIIKRNSISSNSDSPSGALIHVGVEGDDSTYGMSNGSVISGNRCYGPLYFGKTTGTQHGVFIMGQELEFKRNYLIGTSIGVVVKAYGNEYNTVVKYNIIRDCGSGFTIKGAPGTYWYNNTIVLTSLTDGVATAAFDLVAQETYYNPGVKIKNNICADFRTSDDNHIIQVSTEDLVGSEIDYNMYYKIYGTSFCDLDSSSITFAAWQALLQDENGSQVNPEFVDADNGDYSITSESNAAEAGETLGDDYIDGLDSTTDWGDEDTLPDVITKEQTAPWDCGAYVS